MIGIIDCHIGNIGSLRSAFMYLGAPVEVISDPARLAECESIVLPGVGAFDAAMTSLDQSGFSSAVKTYARNGRPVLGICLGLQVLCSGSEEGQLPGLGLIDSRVVNFRSIGCRGKVPHVGFNSIEAVNGESSFLALTLRQDFYFVHSFALPKVGGAGVAAAYVMYEGVRFVAALQAGNIMATQFHPEKSGAPGLRLLRQFLACSRSA